MNDVVFGELLGVIDDSIALAEDAVAEAAAVKSAPAAAAAAPAPEPITLVKVAKARAGEVATSLIKSGAFPDKTVDDLADILEKGGATAHLELLEKLASRAVFPLDLEGDLVGDLVEKPASSRADGSAPQTKTELWSQAMAEAEAECAG